MVWPVIQSIHLFCLSHSGSQWVWSLFQLSQGERWGTPCTGCQSVAELSYRDRQQFTFRFTPAAILQSPINVLMHALLESPIILTACMSLDCLSKPEYAERNRASTGRAWKLGFKPGPLLHCAGPNWLGGKKRLFCVILLSSKRKRLSSHIKGNHLERLQLYCSSLKNNSVCYQTSYLLSFTEMYS